MRPVPRIRAANHDGDVVLAGNTIVATAANFMSDVVEASGQTPVLVDFWAPWCGPCQSLTPLLERLVDDYAGRFILAKLNIDEQPQLATHFQVRSIPTLMLVHSGEVVDQVVGAQPEAAIRAMLDRHVATATTDATAVATGATTPASVTAERPASRDATPDVLAATLLERRDAEGAAAAIEALAASEAAHPALKSLRARLDFLQVANAHPDYVALRESLQANPGDSAARHALAAHHALLGDYGTALAEWLELMRRDRRFGEEAARRSLLEAFDVLGDEDPLVVHYRRRMASLLH
jgi:putative thioredoxin